MAVRVRGGGQAEARKEDKVAVRVRGGGQAEARKEEKVAKEKVAVSAREGGQAEAREKEMDVELLETRAALRQLSHRAFGKIPSEIVVDRVLEVTEGGDFPLRRGAMEALVRRFAFAQRDGLRVVGRPKGGAGMGLYETRQGVGSAGRGRRGGKTRPYRTVLRSIEPLGGSCDCADFQRSGLGLCKHLMTVLDDLAGKPKLWRKGIAEAKRKDTAGLSRLGWDPVRPLVGPGDWLERVYLEVGRKALPGVEKLGPWIALGRDLRRGEGREASGRSDGARAPRDEPGVMVERRYLKATCGLREDKRLELVKLLLGLVERLERREGWEHLVDPVLRPLLVNERAQIEGKRPLAITGTGLRSALRGFKRKIYTYQEEGLRKFCEVGTLLLADDMGLGKTVQAVAACHMLARRGLVRRGLVMVPAALKSQWEREWQACTDLPVTVVDGSRETREAIYRQHRREGFLIVNYEQVLRDLPLMHSFLPEVMILDEAQRIKNWATKTATFVKQLRPKWRLVLTGTPMENRLEELASVMDWVDDRVLEPKWRLVPWHTLFVDGGREAAGARNLATLRQRLAPVMLRRIRQEVLDQLPVRMDTQIPVPMTAGQIAAHQDLAQPISQIMHRAQRRPLTQAEFLRLMQMLTAQRIICNGLAQLDFDEVWPTLGPATDRNESRLQRLESPKLLELRELVEHLSLVQGQKVVLFSQWRRMLSLAHWAVEDLLRREDVRAVFFTGAESQKRRTQNIVDFHDDPSVRLMFCSDAGSVGLNLQRAASCAVILDLPWNPAVLEQRIGRIYRLGQERPVQVYYLVADGGIESRISKLIGDKQALFTGLFDGDSDVVEFESSGSFLSRVEKLVDPVEVPDLPDLEGTEPELALDADIVSASEDDIPDLADEVTVPRDREPDREATRAVRPLAAAPGAPCNKPPESSPVASGQMAAENASPYVVAAHPSGDGNESVAPPARLPPPAEVGALFSHLHVRRREDGGLSIEAPPEAAATLASLFAGMARLLTEAAESRRDSTRDDL